MGVSMEPRDSMHCLKVTSVEGRFDMGRLVPV
jgi:hypothetical protein